MKRSFIARQRLLLNQVTSDRQIILRGNGRVRTINITRKVQLSLLGILALVSIWVAIASVGFVGGESARREEHRRGNELSEAIDGLTQELQLAVASLDASREEVHEREERLRLLGADRDGLADRLAATARKNAGTDVASHDRMQRLGTEIAGGSSSKGVSLLDRLHERTTKTINDLEQAIRSTGIDVDKALAAARAVPPGLGGPFIQFDPSKSDNTSGSAMRLDASLARFAGLQSVIRHMPLAEPLSSTAILSGFGRRLDPFDNKPAMHTGVDLSASLGTPIYTTAPGRVTIADVSGQYGKLVGRSRLWFQNQIWAFTADKCKAG